MLERFHALLNSPLVTGSIQDLASEVAARVQSKPMELLLNARNPLVQSLRDLPNLDTESARALLLGLYHLALLNSQRRIKSETARQIDGYLQTRLGDILRLRRENETLEGQVAAWRQCTANPSEATTRAWAAVMRNLAGSSPGEFRERVRKASDAELGELLLGLYRNLQQA